jgi:polyferredoxin
MKKISLAGWRRITQSFFGVFLANSYFQIFSTRIIYDGPLKSACVPFLNCHACPTALMACPIGMLQHFMALGQVPYFLIGFFIVIGLAVGRAACGWLCPFGLIQDLLYKIKAKKFGIPKFLNYLKYPILVILVIILPYFTYTHWFSKLCPFGALTAGIPWVIWNPIDPDFDTQVIDPETVGFWYFLKIAILIVFLLWFVLSKRPFCRVICPLGAIWGVFNRISLLRFKIKESCAECGSCAEMCPMDLDVNTEVDSENCIKCFECINCEHVESVYDTNFENKTPSEQQP